MLCLVEQKENTRGHGRCVTVQSSISWLANVYLISVAVSVSNASNSSKLNLNYFLFSNICKQRGILSGIVICECGKTNDNK